MRFAACLLVAFVCSGVFASEPGQPLGCEDWVVARPGLTIGPDAVPASFDFLVTDRVALDNEGGRIVVGSCCGSAPSPCDSSPFGFLPIRHLNRSGVVEVLACLPSRSGESSDITLSGCFLNNNLGWWASCVRFNPITGDLHFSYDQIQQNHRYTNSCVLHGLPTLYDVQQTYVPPSAIGFYVPAMPEGMGGADHFDTYWGSLTHPIDFTQAHPLQCAYPTAAPHVGDYLTVPDTVPTPAPGQGVYFVTSATYQGATRYGRKTSNGHLTGREPALLPACTTP